MILDKGLQVVSLLICTLSSDFEGGRKVVLQTQIFFLVGDPEKKVGLYYKLTFFSGWRKMVLQTRIFPEKKSDFAEPLFCHPQNHF